MQTITIPKGKVIKTPAAVRFNHSQQTIPYIVCPKEKVYPIVRYFKELTESFRLDFIGNKMSDCNTHSPRLQELHHNLYSTALWGYWFLTATESIPEVMTGDTEYIQKKFHNAKFIVKLDSIKSATHNFYYVVEDLREDFSIADIITLFTDAREIQDIVLENPENGLICQSEDEKEVRHFIPLLRTLKSQARYKAKHPDLIYTSTSPKRYTSLTNSILAEMIALDSDSGSSSSIQTTLPTECIRDLFAIESPEFQEKLSNARLIKKIDIQDPDHDYYYVAEGDSDLNAIDIIIHENRISKIAATQPAPTPSPEPQICRWCPFREALANPDFAVRKNLFSDQVYHLYSDTAQPKISQRANALETLAKGKMEHELQEMVIRDAVYDIYGEAALEFYDKYLTEEKKTELKEDILKRFNACLLEAKCDRHVYYDCETRSNMTNYYNIGIYKDGTKLSFQGKAKSSHSLYVLILHCIYSAHYKAKNGSEGSANTSFQYRSAKGDDYYDREYEGHGFYSSRLALLYGVLFNVFTNAALKSNWTDEIQDCLELTGPFDCNTVINELKTKDDAWFKNLTGNYIFDDYCTIAFNIGSNAYKSAAYSTINKALYGSPGGKYREILPHVEIHSNESMFNKLCEMIESALPE